MNARELGGVAVAATLFLLVQVGALALAGPFETAGYRAVEDPSDPTNSLVYIGAILVATALMLVAFRYAFDQAVRAVVLLSSAMVSWYVFSVLVPLPVLAVVLAVGVGVALHVHPEWYVVDGAGVVMGMGAGALFGISFGLLPAIVLLSLLAVYDAVSVYGTGHMLDLAEGVMDLRIPVVLVVPLSLSYSLLDDDFSGANEVHEEEVASDGSGEESTDRDAFFIGLGDAVMPTVMVASGAVFSPAAALGVGALPALNLPALLSMVGTFLGLGVLLWAVMRGRAHAGLPLLNGGAIGGYLLGSTLAGVPLVQAVGLAPYL
jgi:presenilin-like A22 family membrane protease